MINLHNKRVLILTVCLLLYPLKSLAQITPDNTLGTENSEVNSIDELRDRIEGGAVRGDNLFHSFQEFNVGEGAIVNFANPEGIANIFSRVTGDKISEIFGSLGVEGAANLFLMNPNGIVFGENSAINVNGSFLATTAENIEFDNGDRFSTASPNIPTLTIDFPIGLGFGSNSSKIEINDRGHNLFFSATGQPPTIRSSVSPGLEAKSGENLAFLAREVNLNGGILIAEEGQIELGAVKQGFVGINLDSWKFDYSNLSSLGDVNLSNTSWVDASSSSVSTSNSINGGIEVTGRNINVKDESAIVIQNQSSNTTGEIRLDASNSINISKAKVDPEATIPGGIISETLGIGSGSDIRLSAPNVSLLAGGSIIARTLGFEQAGNIIINASEKLELSGISILDSPPVASNITNAAFPIGKTGSININASSLIIKDGATITNFATGQSVGNAIFINVNDLKILENNNFSEIYVSSISTNSSGKSRGADIFINADNVDVENGAAIAALTFDFAQPGSVNINASNLVRVTGFDPKTNNPSSIASTTLLQSEALREALALVSVNFSEDRTSASGGVNIQAPKLEVLNGAFVTVFNTGTGDGGNLEINADSISLDNGGEISASTVSGQGGNISLDTDSLIMSNQSNITTNAGGEGNGGNITIDTEVLAGLENSDISANAIAGNGGNIEITSDYIFGFNSTTELTLFSDITASSELGIDGTVTIFSPESNVGEEVIIVGRDERVFKDRDADNDKCSSINEQRVRVQDLGAPIAPNPFDFNYDEDLPDVNGKRLPIANSSPALNEEEIIQANTVKVLPDGRTFLVAETKSNHPVSEPQLCTR